MSKFGTKVDMLSEDLNKKKVHFSDSLEQQEKTIERLEALEEICNEKKPDIEKTVTKILDKQVYKSNHTIYCNTNNRRIKQK